MYIVHWSPLTPHWVPMTPTEPQWHPLSSIEFYWPPNETNWASMTPTEPNWVSSVFIEPHWPLLSPNETDRFPCLATETSIWPQITLYNPRLFPNCPKGPQRDQFCQSPMYSPHPKKGNQSRVMTLNLT